MSDIIKRGINGKACLYSFIEITKFKQPDMENIYDFFTNGNKFTGKYTLAWETKWTC